MTDWRAEFCGDCGETYADCICGGANRREVRHLRGLLARLEWAGTNPRNPVNPHCPVCGGWPANGHYPDCWLTAELPGDPDD